MPLRHKSAQKRARQTVKKTERNKKFRTLIKSAVKNVKAQKEKGAAEAELKKTTTILDRAATKRVIHKNKAANIKSKLTKAVNKLGK